MFQFLDGAIKRERRDAGEKGAVLFQFLDGAIKSLLSVVHPAAG